MCGWAQPRRSNPHTNRIVLAGPKASPRLPTREFNEWRLLDSDNPTGQKDLPPKPTRVSRNKQRLAEESAEVTIGSSEEARLAESCRLPQTGNTPYAYVLGMYLGDGHIAKVGRSAALRIYLDLKYPGIAERCAAAMANLNPFHPTRVRRRGTANVLVVSAYGLCWPELFPQHGPGRKHTRPIALVDWQRDIVTRQPMQFLRGLIESDGSRYVRHVDGHDYPAYEFTNRSEDILMLFCWVSDLLGVGYTRPGKCMISIARRGDISRLDREFGPKT